MGRLGTVERDMVEYSGDDALQWMNARVTDNILDIVCSVFPTITLDDALHVVEFNQTFPTTAGPYNGIAGQAFTSFHIAVVHVPFVALVFVDDVYFGCRHLEGLGFAAAVDDLLDNVARPYDMFVRTEIRETLRPATGNNSVDDDVKNTVSRLLDNTQVHLTELTVLPTGCTMATVDWDVFAATVRPTEEGWAVYRHRGLLSPSGLWRFDFEADFDAQSRRYSLDEAIESAQTAVNVLTVNGKTFAEWEPSRTTH